MMVEISAFDFHKFIPNQLKTWQFKKKKNSIFKFTSTISSSTAFILITTVNLNFHHNSTSIKISLISFRSRKLLK